MTTVRFVVKKGRTAQGAWRVVLDGNHVSEVGVDAESAADAADVTFTVDPADVDALASGSLRLSVAFMRGQVKMSGDHGALLAVLPVLDGAAFDDARRSLFV